VIWTVDSNGVLGPITDLGTFGGLPTQPESINDDRQITGTAYSSFAWRYTPGFGFEDLGTLASNDAGIARAYDINQPGTVAGEAMTTRRGVEGRAFLDFDGAGMISLGTFSPKKDPNDSVAYGVNDNHYAVGMSGTGDTASPYAGFLYHSSFAMVNLESVINGGVPDDLKGPKLNPWRINNAGQICGPRVDNFNGYNGQAYLLTPAP
jgi:hypothetical protein